MGRERERTQGVLRESCIHVFLIPKTSLPPTVYQRGCSPSEIVMVLGGTRVVSISPAVLVIKTL